jgi:ankyrin repeat protein
MLESGRRTNYPDNRGWCAIHYAAHLGRKECFDLLVNAGRLITSFENL